MDKGIILIEIFGYQRQRDERLGERFGRVLGGIEDECGLVLMDICDPGVEDIFWGFPIPLLVLWEFEE